MVWNVVLGSRGTMYRYQVRGTANICVVARKSHVVLILHDYPFHTTTSTISDPYLDSKPFNLAKICDRIYIFYVLKKEK